MQPSKTTSVPRLLRSTLLKLLGGAPGLGLVFVLAVAAMACSDDNPPAGQDSGQQKQDARADGLAADAADGGAQPAACACQADEVCDVQQNCIPWPGSVAGEAYAELTLIAYHNLLSSELIANVGKGTAWINAHDPLPPDTREPFTTPTGDLCWRESGTEWPFALGGSDYWPKTPGLGVGNITFQATGAPSPIVLEEIYFDQTYGWGYNHLDVPPYIVDEEQNIDYIDYFDLVNMPAGAPFQVQLAGGDDVGAATFSGGAIPGHFAITSPAEGPGVPQVSIAQGVQISWTPPQAGAFMEVRLFQTLAGFFTLVRCRAADEGQVTIPASAFALFSPAPDAIQLQLRRNLVSKSMGATATGAPLHVFLVGQRIHSRSFQAVP